MKRAFRQSTLVPALVGSMLLWAAFPPLGLSALAWLAPVSWLVLIREKRLPGRRPYAAIWLAGFAFWLLVLQGLRLAHWATYFGWLALALYLAFYLPAFVALTRISVHKLGLPLILAAPLAWTGLELARGYLITGFSMALVAHTQVHFTSLIQIADVLGAYGVSFIVLFVAACLTQMLPATGRGWSAWPALPLVAVLAGSLLYGQYRLAQPTRADSGRLLKVGLIQGNLDTVFESDPERFQRSYQRYSELTFDALQAHPDLQLIVWPESMFTGTDPDYLIREPLAVPEAVQGEAPAITVQRLREILHEGRKSFENKVYDLARAVNPAANEQEGARLLVGTETIEFGPQEPKRYNSALLIGPSGEIIGRYYKMHPVMFGEYVPFGELFPALYKLTPMGSGLTAGTSPRSFDVSGVLIAPSVCFESTVPHLIRRQIRELTREGQPPDVLVNVTNDGWFWGSSMLDLHHCCAVFRAVENRRPFLVAANTGFSTWIDGNGRIRAKGPRRDEQFLVARVEPDGRGSIFETIGDWPARLCLALTLVGAFVGTWRGRRR